MKTDMTVTMELEVADMQEAERFEDKLRSWLRTQSAVQAVHTANSASNDAAWRASRKETFGSRLPNPFAPGRG